MNVSLAPELSVYKLALAVEAPPQPLPLTSATLLSLVRSQIDLLIEQRIAATLWVKLPPGNIWHSELARYQASLDGKGVIYNCHIHQLGEAAGDKTIPNSKFQIPNFTSDPPPLPVEIQPKRNLRREYFLIVLSPQFCNLILAHRPGKGSKINILAQGNNRKTPPLLAITTFESRVIQRVFDGIKLVVAPELSSLVPADLTEPGSPSPALVSQLLALQMQHSDEINRQKTAERLAKVQQQNEKLHKTLELKDEYLNNVCQELRTPLTHMKTALSLLNSPSLKPPQRQRYLQMLNKQCDRQNSLITGLLDLLHIERNLEGTTLESIRLVDIVPGVVSTYQPLAQEKGIMLAYTVPTELPDVWCVSGGLRQILIHLLSNSIKFTPNGGQVWVRARTHGDFVQLEFRDTGIGIADSEITKIFDRFYRVRPVASEDPGGAGLGLTIVQQLLQRCGGSISVKSKLSEGSTFTVLLLNVSDTPRAQKG